MMRNYHLFKQVLLLGVAPVLLPILLAKQKVPRRAAMQLELAPRRAHTERPAAGGDEKNIDHISICSDRDVGTLEIRTDILSDDVFRDL